MERLLRPRSTAILSDSIHRRLNLYALAATSAGVGVLALTHSAHARVIYTPTHRTIRAGHTVPLDFNHDKITDFIISNRIFSSTDVSGRTLRVIPQYRGNQVFGVRGQGGVYYASALAAGSQIGPRHPFLGKVMAASGMEYGYVGPWRNVSDRYLGVRFRIKGKRYYGWARLSVNTKGNKITAKLTGYAYETVPKKPIIAGKTKGPDVVTVPDTLGGLAKGTVNHPPKVSLPKPR